MDKCSNYTQITELMCAALYTVPTRKNIKTAAFAND